MTIEAWRNGKPIKVKLNAGIVTIPPYFRWYKPWTWRNGSRKGDVFVVNAPTEWGNEGAEDELVGRNMYAPFTICDKASDKSIINDGRHYRCEYPYPYWD